MNPPERINDGASTSATGAAESSRSTQGKLFNDSVHGHIVLPPLCVKIIDTPIFQRLRHLKQLGFGYWVYPGASHNRFEHSLGVCHLAGIIVDVLNKNRLPGDDPQTEITREEKLCVQVAGLCHDLGHGPFSHVWQSYMERINEKTEDDEVWKHEYMSQKLLDEILKDDEVKKEFDIYLPKGDVNYIQMIKDFISGVTPKNNPKRFLYEIVSNDKTGIDVDKWDYLMRDSKYLNLNITFDPYRLLNCQRIMKVEEKGNEYHICYRNKAQDAIWQMYMMRAELHRKAYQHPVVRMLEEMWIDALLKVHGLDSNKWQNTFFGKYYGERRVLSNIYQDTEAYIRLTDGLYYEMLRSKEIDEDARKLLDRIHKRKIYKVWKQITLIHENRDSKYKHIEALTLSQKNMADEKGKPLDLHVTKCEVNMKNLKYLEDNVYLFDKQGKPFISNWLPVPLMNGNACYGEEMLRIEVIFYSKGEETENIEAEVKEALTKILNQFWKKNPKEKDSNGETNQDGRGGKRTRTTYGLI